MFVYSRNSLQQTLSGLQKFVPREEKWVKSVVVCSFRRLRNFDHFWRIFLCFATLGYLFCLIEFQLLIMNSEMLFI